MLEIRVVRMAVHDPLVDVLVSVWLSGRIAGRVDVFVVFVVPVPVGVRDALMLVSVLVPLRDVEPYARGHE